MFPRVNLLNLDVFSMYHRMSDNLITIKTKTYYSKSPSDKCREC